MRNPMMACESAVGATATLSETGRGKTIRQTVPEANMAPDRCPMAGFFAHGGDTEVAGISLVHMAAQDAAKAGDLVTFTAWILNATSEVLMDVSLHLRSFTNERGDPLEYRTKPQAAELAGRTLGPRQALKYHFSYNVTDRDVEEPGLLISALRAELMPPGKGRIFSECDALVSIAVPRSPPMSLHSSNQSTDSRRSGRK